jgi:hypothetical protein
MSRAVRSPTWNLECMRRKRFAAVPSVLFKTEQVVVTAHGPV